MAFSRVFNGSVLRACSQQGDRILLKHSGPGARNTLLRREFSALIQQECSSCQPLQGSARIQKQTYSTAGKNIWKSPFPDVVIPENESLPFHVMKEFSKFGDTVALVNGPTGETTTYAQLTDRIVKVASALTKLGYKKGDVATIVSPNIPEFVVFYLAWTSFGGIISCVNPMYTAVELQHALSHSSAKVVVTVPPLIETVRAAAKGCPELKEIVVVGDADGCRPFSNLLADDGKSFNDNVDIDPKEDLAALPFSSGTTGMPKGVMLTHYSILADVDQLRTPLVFDYKTSDSLLGVLPFFHIYGQTTIMLNGLVAGTKIVTLPKFDAQMYLECAQKYRATFLHVVPPIVLFLANHPLVDSYDFSSVHSMFVGAAPASSEVSEKVMQRLNVRSFRQGFGMTEASPVTHVNPKEGFKFHTCGPPIHNTEHKVVDIETGKELGMGEEGELVIRGPQVMKGYFKNPEATAKTIVDGWLHSGDIGYVDEDGHMVISDRLKELIKFKGYQVAPAELEHILVTHPGILDAAVIGKPDERAGELPRAYVVKKPDYNITDDEIHQFLEGKVADYKKLSGGIEYRSEIPKSAAGKILRRELKAELLEKMKEEN